MDIYLLFVFFIHFLSIFLYLLIWAEILIGEFDTLLLDNTGAKEGVMMMMFT
jgi:hypothetical protein